MNSVRLKVHLPHLTALTLWITCGGWGSQSHQCCGHVAASLQASGLPYERMVHRFEKCDVHYDTSRTPPTVHVHTLVLCPTPRRHSHVELLATSSISARHRMCQYTDKISPRRCTLHHELSCTYRPRHSKAHILWPVGVPPNSGPKVCGSQRIRNLIPERLVVRLH